MDLAIITQTIQSIEEPIDFSNWVETHEKELFNYFYQLNGNDLDVLSFDQFYYKVIAGSKVYNKYVTSGEQLDGLDFLIDLISSSAEKLAEIGLDSLAQTIVADMPAGASRCRLIALNEFALVDDVRTDYFKALPNVLRHLQESLDIVGDDGVRKAVDVLTYFLFKSKKSLIDKGYPGIYEQIKSMFRGDNLVQKFGFLSHQIIVDILNDVDPFALYIEKVVRERLETSPSIATLFRQINNDFFSHPRVFGDSHRYWGKTSEYILDSVLDRGKCDFTIDFGDITQKDKVLIYCFFNMKKHFFTSYAVFQTVTESLIHFFELNSYVPVFIDLGCGPMTSGLALADLIQTATGHPITFSYIGVDIAPAMLAKCEEFSSLSIFSSGCTFRYALHWDEIDSVLLNDLGGTNNPIIFNASYLFASSSLKEDELADYVNRIARIFKNVYFIFQNPDRMDRNLKYISFKEKIQYKSLIEHVEDIRYKAATTTQGHEEVLYEILKLS